jgi:hypothetical protein
MPLLTSSSARLRAENTLLKLLADLQPDMDPDGTFIDLSAGRWRLVLSIGPLGSQIPVPGEPELSECERDCLDALSRLTERDGRRHTAREIDAELRLNGKKFGWATITAALANLIAMKKIWNPKDKRGYGFPREQETRPEPKTEPEAAPIAVNRIALNTAANTNGNH